MAKKISDLTAKGATIATTDLIEISQDAGGGTYVTRSVTGANIKALVTDANMTTTDITTNNVSTSKHGFAPKAPNDATKFLDGTGAYDTVKDSDLSLSDITTNDVSTTKHGFTPKAPNDTTKFLRGDGTWAVPASGSSSGKFGISDSTGAYTYYSTLQAAITAASSGQVVEMFADVTDSTSTAVDLKAGVIIQGNGHTYTHTSATGNTFNVPTNGNYYFNNLIIKRTNTTPTGAFIFNGTNYYINPSMIFQSTYIEYTYTSSAGATPFFGTALVMNFLVDGLRGLSNGNGYMVESSSTIIANCVLENTGAGNCIGNGYNNIVENCYVKTNSGTGIGCNITAIVRNSNAISNTGKGISSGSIYLSSAFSNTNYAFDGCSVYNCTGQSISGNAFYSCVAKNSSGFTTTGSCFVPYFITGTASNCTLYSSSAITANSGFSSIYENCTIICDWNNASGHAVSTGAAYGVVPDVSNCKLIVANSSANCINGGSITVKYANNAYKGATTPVTATITQGVTNTQDNQGNILM